MSTVRQRRKSVVSALAKAIQKAIDNGDTTVTKLAAATGITRQHMYRIIDGKNAPSLANAEAIAKHLGLELTLQSQAS